MSRRYRVLHTITTFPLSSGAAENTTLTLNLLDRAQFEPFLATAPGQSMESRLERDVARLPLRWLSRSINPLKDALAFAELRGVIKHHRFDIVHTHNAKDGILGRWAAHLAHTPGIVHTLHNVSFQASSAAFLNRHYEFQERLAARVTGRFLAVSNATAQKYIRKRIGKPEQYRVVYSGLDLRRYGDDGRSAQERRLSLGLGHERGPWIGWFGRFNPQKDPLTFVLAAKEILLARPNVRFVLCGDDPLRESLENDARTLASQLNIGAQMHFLGFRPDLPNVIRAVDVVVQSSRYEGMGRIICEALACERPVVATAVDGVVEVVDSGRRGGLLVPPKDAHSLAAQTLRLLDDPGLAHGLARAGRIWVSENLSAERMVRRVESTYLELMNGP